jgi:hypothetical protein
VVALHKKGSGVEDKFAGRRFKSRGLLVFLRIFLLRNAPAGKLQLVAEDLMEDGTISRISNAYSLRRGRRKPPA